MKCIDGHELTVISDLVFELERRLEYYGDDMEPDCKSELEDALSTLNGILKKPNFTPEVKYIEVEVPVEKLLNSKEVVDRIKMAERHGRELVNPNFKYCVFSNATKNELYVTDDFEKALSKAKSMSMRDDYPMCNVLKIKQASDGTYKTYYEECYNNGKPLSNRINEEFLHFDYLAQITEKVVKI